jgi:SOS-response transcriptional repressor LexA
MLINRKEQELELLYPKEPYVVKKKEYLMTEKQRTVFLVIDEYWKNFGYGPSIDDIMYQTGDKGRGNVHRVVKKLCDLGICKRVSKSARSVRPSYLSMRNI